MATEEQLSDEILKVWTEAGGSYKRAADEINLYRFHFPLMESNLEDVQALNKSVVENGTIAWAEVNRLREFLEQIAEGRVEDVRAEAERVRQESYKL